MKDYQVGELIERGQFQFYYQIFKHESLSDTVNKVKALSHNDMTYGDVSSMLKKVEKNDYEALFELIWGVKKDEIYRLQASEFFRGLNWIKNEVLTIQKKEKLLKVDHDVDLDAAGIEELNKYGRANVIISLAKEFHKDIEEVQNWKYSKVYLLLSQSIDTQNVNKRYMKIKSKAK